MAGRASKMYKDSPTMKRSDAGDMEIGPRDKPKVGGEHMEKHGGTAGTEEAIPHHVRHAHERNAMHKKHMTEHMEMHHRHMHEHHMHDHMGHGEKSEMHKRHHAEKMATHKMHEKEMVDMHSRHENEGGADMGPETGGGQISKVENQE